MLVFGQMLMLSFVFAVAHSFAASQIYTYRDDSGTPNFTTELDSIPEKYRSRVVPLDSDTSSPVEAGVPSPPLAAVRVVTASGEYRMGDHDTRADAVRLAIEAAKRQALEQVATYLESVTEVKNLDVTRDEIRAYTAGVVTVLNQQVRTRLEDGTVVIYADLTAQVDRDEVISAINGLRDNEGAALQLASLRTEADLLHQQLDAATQALAAAQTAEQVRAATLQRQQLLNQMQADNLVSQALAGYAYITPAKVQQINDLLGRARHLHPSNPHVSRAEHNLRGRDVSPTQQLPEQGHQPGRPFVAQSPLATPLPQSPLATPLPPSPLAEPLPQ